MAAFLVLFCFFPPHWHAHLRSVLLQEKGKTVMGLSQNVELTSRKWFPDNNCVQATTLSHCCNNSLWKAYHTPTHTCSFLEGWGNQGRGTLSAPDSAGSLHWLTGHSLGCWADTIPWTARSKRAWALPSVQTEGRGLDSLGMSGRGTEVAFSRMHSYCRRGLFTSRAVHWEGAA